MRRGKADLLTRTGTACWKHRIHLAYHVIADSKVASALVKPMSIWKRGGISLLTGVSKFTI